jgi:hypothetical protein
MFVMAGLLCAAVVLPALAAGAQADAVLEVGKFSTAAEGSALPDGWKPLTFPKVPKHTAYAVVKDGGASAVKATSEASASGLTKEVPIVRWRWKVENLLKTSDVRTKAGDDYPARLYITFQYDPDKVSFARKVKYMAGRALFGDIPIAALNYIWDSKAPVGTIVENAYTDFARMIVVESGAQGLGAWKEEERNIYEDYKKAFGGEPPMINGVAIMSDTDNTKESAAAYFGDIVFVKAK